ncbi:hypothetical protein PIB30_088767, partial [Stylosanthes scabra]|nr:hypothetical protein [Stylosanthes scabra]
MGIVSSPILTMTSSAMPTIETKILSAIWNVSMIFFNGPSLRVSYSPKGIKLAHAP